VKNNGRSVILQNEPLGSCEYNLAFHSPDINISLALNSYSTYSFGLNVSSPSITVSVPTINPSVVVRINSLTTGRGLVNINVFV